MKIKAYPRRARTLRELDYRLIKEVWTFCENRIAVRFAYEWHDDSDQWFRSYGNENWEFDERRREQGRSQDAAALAVVVARIY